jgi:hypothetical protein
MEMTCYRTHEVVRDLRDKCVQICKCLSIICIRFGRQDRTISLKHCAYETSTAERVVACIAAVVWCLCVWWCHINCRVACVTCVTWRLVRHAYSHSLGRSVSPRMVSRLFASSASVAGSSRRPDWQLRRQLAAVCCAVTWGVRTVPWTQNKLSHHNTTGRGCPKHSSRHIWNVKWKCNSKLR